MNTKEREKEWLRSQEREIKKQLDAATMLAYDLKAKLNIIRQAIKRVDSMPDKRPAKRKGEVNPHTYAERQKIASWIETTQIGTVIH